MHRDASAPARDRDAFPASSVPRDSLARPAYLRYQQQPCTGVPLPSAHPGPLTHGHRSAHEYWLRYTRAPWPVAASGHVRRNGVTHSEPPGTLLLDEEFSEPAATAGAPHRI